MFNRPELWLSRRCCASRSLYPGLVGNLRSTLSIGKDEAMVVEYIRYKIPSGDIQAFEADYGVAASALETSAHCLGYELSRCMDEPGRYMLRIEWDSVEGHMHGFRNSDAFGRFFAAIKPYVGQIEEMQHYEQTPVRSVSPVA